MYKQIKDLYNNISNQVIRRVADGACIPFDPDNVDYQAYLRWCAEGNEPLPADET